MELRPLNTPEGICAELLYLAWQERAAARVERTNKQRTAEAEHAAQAMECLAADIDHGGRAVRGKVAEGFRFGHFQEIRRQVLAAAAAGKNQLI